MLVVMITLSFGVSAYAAGEQGDGESGGSGGGGSSTAPYRISKYHNGFLCYIVDKNRNLVASPMFVKCPSCELWPGGSLVNIKNRIGAPSGYGMYAGDIGAATMGKFNKPAFDTSGYGYGSELKSVLISHTGAGGNALVYDFISNVWNVGVADAFKNSALGKPPEESHVLCIEAVSWTGLTKSGPMAVVTAWTAQYILSNSTWQTHGRYAQNHLRYRLQVCGYVNKGWIGQHIAVDTGSALSDAAISDPRSGYGMIMVRASEMGDTTIDPPPVEYVGTDYLLADELNRGFTDLIESHNDGRNWDEYEKYFDIATL